MNQLDPEQFRFNIAEIGVFNPDYQPSIDRYDLGYIKHHEIFTFTDVLVFTERLRSMKSTFDPGIWPHVYQTLLHGRAAFWLTSLSPGQRQIVDRKDVEEFCVTLKKVFLLNDDMVHQLERVHRYRYNDDYMKKDVPLGPHLYRHLLWFREYLCQEIPHEDREGKECALLGPDPKGLLTSMSISGSVWGRTKELLPGGKLEDLKTVDQLIKACNQAWEELRLPPGDCVPQLAIGWPLPGHLQGGVPREH